MEGATVGEGWRGSGGNRVCSRGTLLQKGKGVELLEALNGRTYG